MLKFYLLAFIALSLFSCQKDNVLVEDLTAEKNESTEKRLNEINEFIKMVKSDGLESRNKKDAQWTPQEFESLTEDAINVKFSHNLTHFSKFYTKFDTLTFQLSGCKIAEKDAKKLFNDILKSSQDVYKAKSADLKRLALVSLDVVQADCNQMEISLMTKIGLKYKELQVQSRNVIPGRPFMFDEGTWFERHAQGPLPPSSPLHASVDCYSGEPVYTSAQIADKAYNNYWYFGQLPAPGTFINQNLDYATSLPCAPAYLPGLWYGPDGESIHSGCATEDELNGYVNILTDWIYSKTSANKYCIDIICYDFVRQCFDPVQHYRVWQNHAKFADYVVTMEPPCCFE